MNVFICILVYAVLLFVCFKNVFQKKLWREATIIFVMITAGFVLSLLLILEVDVPNPNKHIGALIKLIFKQE